MKNIFNILLIDDDQLSINIYEKILLSEGYCTFSANSAGDAFAILRKEEINCIICDQVLPNMQGTEFLKVIKSQFPDTIRILITGYADVTLLENAINEGEIYRFIKKPVDMFDFLLMINQAKEFYLLKKKNIEILKQLENKVKITNKELELSERKLRTLYMNIPSHIFEIDTTGRIISINRVTEGVCSDDFINKSVFEIIPEEERQKFRDSFSDTMDNGNVNEFEAGDLIFHNGETWYSYRFAPVSVNNEDTSVILVMYDISRRKNAENAIIESEKYYRTLLSNMHEDIIVIDKNYLIKDINKTKPTKQQYSKEEIIDKPCYLISQGYTSPCHENDEICYLHRVFDTGIPHSCLHKHLRKDGREVYYDILFSPMKDPSGNITHVIEATRDRSDLMRIKIALEQSEKKYRELIEGLNEGICILDDSSEIIFANSKAAELLHTDINSLLMRNFTEFISPGTQSRYLYSLAKVREGEKVYLQIQLEPGKCKLQALLALSAKKSINKEIEGIYLAITDISQQLRFQNELEKTTIELRRLSDYLHSAIENERKRIAHEIHDELGMSLTVLKMDLKQIAQRLSTDKKKVDKYLSSMFTLIDSTIEGIQRLSSELRPGVLDQFGFNEAIDWLVNQFMKRSSINITFQSDLDDSNLDERFSLTMFRIIQESLSNIIRHAQADKVSVRIQCRNSYITISVQDNGCGFDTGLIDNPDSFGLLGIRERVAALNGILEINSRVSAGTEIIAQIPIVE